MEVRSRKDRLVYRSLLIVLKCFPMLLALCEMVNTVLDFFGIDTIFISLLGGLSLLPMLFLYLASYAFKFCEYHRAFLHYIVFNELVTCIDYTVGIPVSDKAMFSIYTAIAGMFLFLVLYLHRKECCKQ